MSKAKLTITTKNANESESQSYVCNYQQDKITYTNREKVTTTITLVDEQLVTVLRTGSINSKFIHDGHSKQKTKYNIQMYGLENNFEIEFQNKYLSINKYDKIVSIEIHFINDQNELIEQIYKVEVK